MLAFVLGGGGSRGALQAGALQVLLEAGLVPDMVVGTSVGALNGAFLAADPTRQGMARLQTIWMEIRGQDIYPGQTGTVIWNMARGHQSLFENSSWHSLLQRIMPAERFGDLSIPCYAVAVDIETADIVVFGDDNHDRVVDGLMSSSALTPIHPAWEIEGRHYVDGGFGAVLPIRQAVERGATEIIALNLTNMLQSYDQIKTSADMLVHNIDLLMFQQVRADLQYAEAQPNLRIKAIDLHAPNYLPPTDFSQTAELLELGKSIMVSALQEGLWSSRNRIPA